MQVNSASSFISQATASQAVESNARLSSPEERLTARQQQQKTQQDSQPEQRPNRLELDQQVIARLEQEQDKLANSSQSAAPSSTAYDQPSQANQTAVFAYQSVDNINQRESIQQTFGVDLYA